MVTTELKRIPRTCPPDGAVIKYGIELNHADDSGSDRPIGQLRGTPVRIIVPIADRSLTTSNPARHSEAHQRSPYRVNCARCLGNGRDILAARQQGTARDGLSRSSRRPRGAHGRTQALGMSWIRREEEQRKGTGG